MTTETTSGSKQPWAGSGDGRQAQAGKEVEMEVLATRGVNVGEWSTSLLEMEAN